MSSRKSQETINIVDDTVDICIKQIIKNCTINNKEWKKMQGLKMQGCEFNHPDC